MTDVILNLALVSREGTKRDQMGIGSQERRLTGENPNRAGLLMSDIPFLT